MEEQKKNLNMQPVAIQDEMKRSYLDYAMSVIVSRAIPDVCDGLKPVHRRILYSMYETSSYYNKPYKKSARIVGEVMGKYHPHGDAAIYDALVRMAQDFSMRLPLIDGQGNFGSMDGDSPAAMRYTESRLEKVAHTILEDIDKDTVDFSPNYDGQEKEPNVLPARYPNLLVNGAGGIAVGMATNIPPHNLGEVITATIAYIHNHDISLEELYEIVPAPDFPTGGTILGRSGSRSMLFTGRGSVILRAKTEIEEQKSGRKSIIVTEIPYQVNKARMIEKIAELVRDKRVEGISDLRDESNKKGVRVVIELKKDAFPEIVLNQLYSYSQLQVSFGGNMLALNNGRPELLNLFDIIKAFVKFRENVVSRRTLFLLNKARARAHSLIGLVLAVDAIDEVISIIKSSKDTSDAKQNLLARKWDVSRSQGLLSIIADNRNEVKDGYCHLTDVQVQAILDMKLARLTALERDKLEAELYELKAEIEKYLKILNDRNLILKIIEDELNEIKEAYATPRKTKIEESEFEHDIEDLIVEEDMVVTVTVGGYIKRVPLNVYRAQRRGGKGRAGLKTQSEDVLRDMFVTTTHTPVLFFSNFGQVYRLKVYKLPLSSPQAQGRALVNIFPLKEGEKITTIMPLPKDEEKWKELNLMFATAKGNIRRSDMNDFININAGGKIAIRLDDNDSLIGVKFCSDSEHVLLASKYGKSVRFEVSGTRVIKSRTSNGVRGMKLADGDEVISLTILKDSKFTREQRESYLNIEIEKRQQIKTAQDVIDLGINAADFALSAEEIAEMAQIEEFILAITENGFGKRTSAFAYRVTSRGGSGIINIVTSDRNGDVAASFPAHDDDQVIMMTDRGKLIRINVGDIRVAGRSTQGVTLLKTDKSEKVVSVAYIEGGANESEEEEGEDNSEEYTAEFNVH